MIRDDEARPVLVTVDRDDDVFAVTELDRVREQVREHLSSLAGSAAR